MGRRRDLNYKELAEEAVSNLRQDRNKVIDKIVELEEEMQKLNNSTAALQYAKSTQKFFDSLQKNNDTYVKIISILEKNFEDESEEDLDEEVIFDQLQKEHSEGI